MRRQANIRATKHCQITRFGNSCEEVLTTKTVPDAQRRVHDLIESSLTALRVNIHSALNTNAKIITDWKELADRFGPAAK